VKSLFKLFERAKPLFDNGGRFRPFKPVFDALENFFFGPATTTTAAPHIRDPLDVKRFMSMVIVALIGMMLLIGLFGAKSGWAKAAMPLVAFGALVVIILIFGQSAGWWEFGILSGLSDWVIGFILMLLIFGVVIVFITHNPDKKKPGGYGVITFIFTFIILFIIFASTGIFGNNSTLQVVVALIIGILAGLLAPKKEYDFAGKE
jgi:hypothetical protein